jgi:hypothetical protein
MNLTTMLLISGALVLVLIIGGYLFLSRLSALINTPTSAEPHPGLHEAMKEEGNNIEIENGEWFGNHKKPLTRNSE